MLIHVTQDDIDQGRPGNSYECPIARAISRETGEETEVGGGYFQLHSWKQYKTLPDHAVAFIETFDTKGPEHVQPITLDLPI
jgi:hypothetical protein